LPACTGRSRTPCTLFAAVTQGYSWNDVAAPIKRLNWIYVTGLLTYLVLSLLGVMNVVTSIFVESAILSAQRDRDLIAEEKEMQKQLALSHMTELFHQIDIDESGEITMDELEYFLTEPSLKGYVEALGINAETSRMLFRLRVWTSTF